MGKKITLRLLFVIALLVLSSVGVKAEARKFSPKINRKLKLLNRPAIKKIVDWGGEVYSSKLQHAPHTTTAMGNGNFPLPYLCNSGCITRMRIHDNSPTLKFPDWVETYTDDYNCYDVMYVGDYIEDPEFFYGGPVFLFERDRESEGMEKRITLRLLFVIALLVLSSVDVEGKARKITSEVNRKLKLLNKPAAKSIKSEDGDIIDCVDIYKQPAFDHPALKNHKIEMRPSISFPSDTTTAAKNESSQRVLSQIWHKSGSCPKGTIPIRRITRKELLGAASIEHFGREGPRSSFVANTTNNQSSHFVYRNNGTEVNVFPLPDHSMRPSISFPSDTTTAAKNESSQRVLSQIWHKSGSCPKGTIPIRRITRKELLGAASIEHFGREGPRSSFVANTTNNQSSHFVYRNNGTEVNVFPLPDHSTSYLITLGYSYVGARGNINIWNPRVQSPDEYTTAQIWLKSGPGDSFESIEAGWMLDSYQKTGCINLICSGFDPNQKRWWLKFGDDVIGYWPFEILTYMQQKAVLVQWGGDVYSKNVKGVKPHTTTAMGSGDDASALLGAACYINKLRILDYSLQLKYPEWVHTDSEEPYCYSSLNYQKSLAFEPTLFFGGPGRSRYCP
ncbi:hypothetical protein CFP56_036864 [Quercus suber]|uniref:Neprosin PEP catalytic domain-containing protein n=1 Tax=Quercus suber TaxID=58331 RepID=A0AAW0LRK5_QUESU